MPELNQPAPDFTLPSTEKDTVTLSDLRGKKVVLAFYPAAFTGGCETELCTFRDSLAAFNDLGADVYAISADLPFSGKAFASQHGFGFTVLADFKTEVIRAYGIAHDDFAGFPGYTAAKRSVFVIDGDGILRWSWVTDTPSVLPDFDAVKAAVAAL